MLDNKNHIKNWLDKHGVKNYIIRDDLTVDVNGEVDLNYKKLTEIPVQFGIINGFFYCHGNENLKELQPISNFDILYKAYKNELAMIVKNSLETKLSDYNLTSKKVKL